MLNGLNIRKNMFGKIITQLLIALAFALSQASGQNAPEVNLSVEPTWLTMRDSAKVATYLFAADSTQPKPTILLRTPNGLQEFEHEIGQFIQHQYSVVVQLTKRHIQESSQTKQCGWMHPTDGYDTIEWIAAQPWSNGKIGMFGRGISSFTQILAAGSEPPHLTAQYLIATPFNFHDELVFPGGSFRKPLAEKIKFPQQPEDSVAVLDRHYTYDDFWLQFNALQYIENIEVPMAFVSGWYDAYAKGTIRAFQAVRRFAGKAAKSSARLRIGPWTDNQDGIGQRRQGEFIFPENASFDIVDDAIAWFDRWLKGENVTLVIEPPVHYYLMSAVDDAYSSGNIWQQSGNWPPENQAVKYFLKKDGGLGTENDEKGTAEGYRYDPENPVPTRGGANVHLEAGPMDQQGIEERSDVLLFTSPPLIGPLTIAGKLTVRLYVTSTAYDTDFTAKLTDVYPDGRSILIADGIVRTRLRGSPRFEKLITPDKVYGLEIDLGHIAYQFSSGHRIRLAISSSNSPRFEPNPNAPFSFHKHKRSFVAVNTVYYGGSKASFLRLPVIALPK